MPNYQMLAAAIHRRIIQGSYGPGERLPTEKDFAAEFGVSLMTVRQGMGLLARKGLVVKQQGRGTFVRERQPALCQIALLFGFNISHETAYSYRALLGDLQEAAHRRNWSCRFYDRLDAADPQADEQREMLLADHANSPFSGVVEITRPQGSPVPLSLSGLPSATYSWGRSDVKTDQRHFGRQVVRQLAKQGCRRLVFFQTRWALEALEESVRGMNDEARVRGLPAPVIHVEEHVADGSGEEKRLFEKFRALFESWENAGRKALPDGLIFNDNVVLRAVTPILYAHRKMSRKKIAAATLGIEGAYFHHAIPAIRYEISTKAIAENLLSILEKRISGQPAEPVRLRGRLCLEQA